MAARSSFSESNVVSPLEDALDLVICLRGIKEPPGDAALGSLQRKLEEALAAFDELWEKAGFPKHPRRNPRRVIV